MENLFNGVYKNRKVLLTGHTGFKGSWLLLWLQQMGAIVKGASLPPNTIPSHIELLNCYEQASAVDIRNQHAIQTVINDFQPEIIFHLAAQPLVRYSYKEPIETFQTNIIGTLHVLEAARGCKSIQALVNITTDKVYENFETEHAYNETDKLGGHDPYSTSKACVELVHECYHKSFFQREHILSVTARAGNVIGGGDWAEDRLIPDVIRASVNNQIAEIRNPHSVRPWQHVLDPIAGYLLLGMHLLNDNQSIEGGWNFGPETTDCISVKHVLNKMQQYWPELNWQDVSDREKVYEANLLKLDCTKAKQQLKWNPIWNVQQALETTANWYKAYHQHRQINSLKQLEQFVKDAVFKEQSWATLNHK